jgi:transcriptional regulator with XRE-family HTH domain
MVIGERLRQLREEKKLSQGDIEKRTGLLRCYSSRVENGHTVPAIETLEKYARALEVPLYKLFYDGDKPPKNLKLTKSNKTEWGASGKEHDELRRFAKLLSRLDDRHRQILLKMALEMARKKTLPSRKRHHAAA